MAVRSILGLVLTLAGPLAAQGAGRAVQEAMDLERRGRNDAAAAGYRAVLVDDPANAAALAGLERTLTALRRLESAVPYVRAALARDSASRTVRALELRVWAALGQADSVVVAAGRWIALDPGSPEPYREWAAAASRRGDLVEARRVLADGAHRVGDASLTQDLAQVTTLAGEWVEATRQWAQVVRGNLGLLPTASANLGRAPPEARDGIVGALSAPTADPTARLLTADLLAAWGRPGEAWVVLDAALPADRAQAATHLARFVERTRGARTREGSLVRAHALERLLALSTGPGADRTRLQAAQAYAEAGDLGAAEHLLRGLAPGGAASGGAVASAMASLIGAMAEEGLVEQAEERLRQWEGRLSGDARRQLVEAVGWGWMTRGDLDRAERLVRGDSTVEGTALRGWIALYRGELDEARARFRDAGPYAGSREAATDRTEILALLERVHDERLPELGHALLVLARRDSSAAVEDLERAARRLPAGAGRPDVLTLAGRVAARRNDFPTAERLLTQAIAADTTGPATAVAELALARVHRDQGRFELAVADLEHLIVSHPESAEVPHARRMLDQLRGAVP
ncbi:MAG TPA: tetratricopeptide repeat protein [Gemmatimonadales bacterium]